MCQARSAQDRLGLPVRIDDLSAQSEAPLDESHGFFATACFDGMDILVGFEQERTVASGGFQLDLEGTSGVPEKPEAIVIHRVRHLQLFDAQQWMALK